MSSNRVRTTTQIHLADHPEASFRVRNLGRTSGQFHPSFTLDIEGDGSWADVVIHLTLPQLRQLRADLARVIEPALAGIRGESDPALYRWSGGDPECGHIARAADLTAVVCPCGARRYERLGQVSVDEAVQRG